MAMRVWTEQELQQLEARIEQLAKSDKLEDNITSILLNSSVGGARMHEEHAGPKAKAITALVKKHVDAGIKASKKRK